MQQRFDRIGAERHAGDIADLDGVQRPHPEAQRGQEAEQEDERLHPPELPHQKYFRRFIPVYRPATWAA